MNHKPKWYTRQFDPNWVICLTSWCRAQFTYNSIKRRLKCPICKRDNYGRIKPTKGDVLHSYPQQYPQQ